MNTQILIGKIVTLKPLSESFFDEYHMAFSPVVRNALHLPLVATRQQTHAFLASMLSLISQKGHLFFCIFDNQKNRLIGALEVRDPAFVNGQLGAWLNESYWGGGRYQEALNLALTAYFDYSKTTTVNVLVDVDNVRSVKAHQKYGFSIVEEFVVKDEASICYGLKVYRLVYSKQL